MYDLKAMGVSMLWLMWEMYECWDVVYFDFLSNCVKFKSKYFFSFSLSLFFLPFFLSFFLFFLLFLISQKNREEFLQEQAIKNRQEDEEYLANLTLTSHPLIRRVNEQEIDRVVDLMMQFCFVFF